MEELQWHVDDAIFVDAVQNDLPVPTQSWVFPTLEEVDAYINKVSPLALELEEICGNCLGFYLFVSYLRAIDKHIFGDFLMDVCAYKKSRRGAKTVISIVEKYLGNKVGGKVFKKLPPSLMRTKPQIPETFDWRNYIDFENGKNLLNIVGEPLEVIEEYIRKMAFEEHVAEEGLSETIFDEVEYVIFTYVKAFHFAGFRASPIFSSYLNFMILSERSLTVDDFTLFRVLGRGGFGVVNGCKHSRTGKLYAMKVMERRRIKSMRAETLCIAERNTMVLVADSQFIVGLKYAFTTPTDLYLVLELMLGGDLGYALFRRGPFRPEQVMYYSVRTLLGLKSLHDLGIVFRDLKPENILMDDRGRTKLSDLGLAVQPSRNGIRGTCGSRGYWAPEMLRRDADGKKVRYRLAVDWFSFGCVVMEFVTGVCPFRTTEAKIWNGIEPRDRAMDAAILEMEPHFRPGFDPVLRSLCEGLLDKNELTRLGANGAQEVMAHPYFADVNWDAYCNDLIPPPFVPGKDLNAASQHEIGNFNDKKLEEVVLTPLDLEIFHDWNYIRSSSFLEEIVNFKRCEEIHGEIEVLKPASACCTIS